MSRFRVENARFRILKGGKIGMNLSISLIACTLIFGSVSGFALEIGGSIAPVDVASDTDVLEDITDADNTGTLNLLGGTQKVTGNVGVVGNKLGIINAGANSSTSTFEKDVYATTTNIGAGTVDFSTTAGTTSTDIVFTESGTAKLNQGLTGNIDFGVNDAKVEVLADKNITGNITTAGTKGILNLLGGDQSVTGTIGTSSTDRLEEINAGATGATSTFGNNVFVKDLKKSDGTIDLKGDLTVDIISGTTGGTLTTSGTGDQTITGSVNGFNGFNVNNATKTTVIGNVNILNTNIKSASTLELANNSNITSTIKGPGGKLTLAGGTQTVTGDVGETGLNKLGEINAGVTAGLKTTFTNDVYATTTTIGDGTVDFSTTGITDTNIVFTGVGTTGTANLNNGLTGNITTTGTNGTLNLLGGNQSVTGTVGASSTNRLNVINAGASGTSTFEKDIFSATTNIGAGTVDLKGNLTGNVTPKVAGQGTLTITGTKDQTITGAVGNIGNLDISNTLFNTTIAGNVDAANTKIDSSLIMTDGSDITSRIKGTGDLTLNGSSIIDGKVGTELERLNSITTKTGAATFTDDVYAKDIAKTGTGTTTFNKGVNAQTTTVNSGIVDFNTASGETKSNIVLSGTGIANLNRDVTGNITGTGTVNTVGSNKTISGNIANIGDLNITTGITTVDGNINSTITNIDSSLIMKDGKNITSKITGAGNLTLQGSSTVTGKVGTAGSSLGSINTGAAGTTSTFTGNVNSENITNVGTGTTNFKDNVIATNVNVDNGISNFQKGLTAATTTIKDGTGNFNTVSGSTQSDIVFSGDGTANLYEGLTGEIDFAGKNATVNVTSGKDITAGTITSTGTQSGTLNLEGSSTIAGAISNIANVKSGADGSESSFIGTVDAKNITNTGTGTSIFGDDVRAGNVNINSGTTTFKKDLTLDPIGKTTITSGTGNFEETANTDILFTGDGVANLSKGLTGAVTTTSLNQGTLNLIGNENQIVSGIVGDINNSLKTVNAGAGANGSEVIFKENVFAKDLNVTGSGTVKLAGDLKGDNLTFNANGNVELANEKNITSNIIDKTGNGILTLNGKNTISGTVGSSGLELGTISLNGNGAAETTTFKENVYVNNVSKTGDETVTFENNLTATNVDIQKGIVNLNNGLNGNVNSTGNLGTLRLEGNNNQTVTGDVKVGNIDSGIAGTTSTFNKTVNSQNITNTETGTTNFKDNVIATNVNVNDGISNFEKGLTATTTAIKDGTGNFNTVSGSTQSDIVFSGDGTANLYEGLTGEIDFAGKNATVNVANGKILDGDINTNITKNTGIINFEGGGDINGVVGNIAFGIKELNVNTEDEQKDSIAPSNELFVTREIYADIINLRNNASLVLKDNPTNNVNITNTGIDNRIIIATDKNDTGTLAINGTSTIDGIVGTDKNRLKEIKAIEDSSNATFTDNVYATNTKVANGTVNFEGEESVTDINITGNGTINFTGIENQTLIGKIESTSPALGILNIDNPLAKSTTVDGNINIENININSTLVMTDGSDITSTIKGPGNLILDGSSVVTGKVGAGNALGKVSAGVDASNSTFRNDIFATNLYVEGKGTVNLDENYTGTALQYNADGTVNLENGSNIINADVRTTGLSSGTLNMAGTSIIDGQVGDATNKLKEINANGAADKIVTFEKDVYVTTTNLGAGTVNLNGDYTGDVLRYNADGTVKLADGSDINAEVTTRTNDTGTLAINGTSTINGIVGTDKNRLKEINTGITGSNSNFSNKVYATTINVNEKGTVNFTDMAYVDDLKYNSDGGTVVLNGQNAQNGALVGNVDFSDKVGNLQIGDDVNITSKYDAITFENANNANLKFNGNSEINGQLGGYYPDKTVTDSTLNVIEAGKGSDKVVTFKDDVYAKDKLLVSDGTVNLKGNLYSDLLFDKDGTVNVEDNKFVEKSIKTEKAGDGSVNFKGTTALKVEIGEEGKELKAVTIASEGQVGDVHKQTFENNIYAQNTTIGNGLNSTILDFEKDINFGGNLDIRKNGTLNINDNKIVVKDNIKIADTSHLNFTVYTTDLSAGQAVENGDSGRITAQSLAIANDAKFKIDYVGSWEGKGQYSLIATEEVIEDIDNNPSAYYATEQNGLVRDNNIIDSVITVDGTNLVLKADRTGGGSFAAEDLYIVKSGIGKDYSNGASQSLAGYANEKNREGALADIIREIEYLEDGVTVSDAKKQQMIDIQRKLAPTANGSNIQASINSSKMTVDSIKGRINNVRVDNIENSFNYSPTGLSSGEDYYEIGDSTLWIKAVAQKSKQQKVDAYEGFDTKSYGFVGGIDTAVNDAIVGISGSYFDTKTSLKVGDEDTSTIGLTLYGSQQLGNAYVDGYLSYAQHSTDSKREANSGIVSSKIKAQDLSAKIETGYNIQTGDGAYVTPFVSVQHSLLNQKGYTEQGSKYQNDALKVDSLKLNRTTAQVGAKVTGRIELEKALIIPHLTLSASNAFGDNSPNVKAQFVGGGENFVTPYKELNKTMFSVGAGVEAKISDSASLILDMGYDRSKDGKFEGYSGNVTFGFSF